jgi:dTDP-4-amino-4,6-dideoxygalactose transaminase
MNVPLLDLKAQYATIRDKVRAAVDGVFESQRFVLGPNVAALEAETARLCDVPDAIGLASGTDALLLSLKAVGTGPGDAVVTVPFTFFATAGAVVNLGARPVFVDIEPAGYNMDPSRLAEFFENDCTFDLPARKLVHRQSRAVIKAIVPVHLYGQCAEMDEILAIARRYELPVIEDACQALGAKHIDRYAGSMGDLGCFSFFPSKNLGGAGDGGMVVSGNKDLARKIRLLRSHGMEPKYYHSIVGFNSRLDEIQAAVLRVKLGFLNEWNQGRRRNAAAYEAAFLDAGLRETVKIPAVLAGKQHIFHQYVIRCPKRDQLRAFLQNHGIGTEIYYPLPLHRQECFRSLGYGAADFPCSNEAAEQCLALPIYPELTPEQISYVVRCIAEFYA